MIIACYLSGDAPDSTLTAGLGYHTSYITLSSFQRTLFLEKQMKFPVSILAAGKSERMDFPKLLLASQGILAVEQIVHRLSISGWNQVGITISDKSLYDFIMDKMPQVDIIFNPEPEEGMISSIRLGLDWAGDDAEGLLTLPVDHPLIRVGTFRELRSNAEPDKIIVPVFNNHRGHPTWWGRSSWDLLKSSIADNGAKDVLKASDVEILEISVDDDNILLNINTPEEAIKHNLEKYQFENN